MGWNQEADHTKPLDKSKYHCISTAIPSIIQLTNNINKGTHIQTASVFCLVLFCFVLFLFLFFFALKDPIGNKPVISAFMGYPGSLIFNVLGFSHCFLTGPF